MNDNQQRPALGKYSFRSWVESEFADEPEVSPPPTPPPVLEMGEKLL